MSWRVGVRDVGRDSGSDRDTAKDPLFAYSGDDPAPRMRGGAPRIAILIYSLRAGGAERVTATIANEWARRGRIVTVATLCDEPDFYGLDPAIRRVRLGIARGTTGPLDALGANIKRIRELRGFLRAEAPGVLVCMMTTTAVLGIIASTGLGIRVIVSERVHPPSLPVGPLWGLARRIAYPRASAVVVLASESARWIGSHARGSRVVVIPNPVALPLPTIEPIVVPASRVSPAERVVLAVGRLVPQKGYDVLLDAFGRLASQFSNWKLLIVGDGPCREMLAAKAKDLRLARQVIFLGEVGNIADWYRRADLFVLSSRFEGFPNVLAEAMAHGCPAISFDCQTGPRDIIRAGLDGLLVNPAGGAEALAGAMRTLMSDDALRSSFAARCREIRERLSPGRVMQAWDELIVEP